MTAKRVLKNLLLVSAFAGALLVVSPVSARDSYRGEHQQSGHDRAYRGDSHNRHLGNSWGGRGDYRRGDSHHGKHYSGRGHRSYGHHNGWGHRSYGHYYSSPGYYYRPSHHRHHRGCGHNGYGHGGLVEFLFDYSHHDY
ncbi:hypothetical protein [Immundisolibacter sp.]|uniref:hypothetical protein n=1 Tax=Immundisolibacter sp. TaxID=1934948 RepID=UPI0035671270